MHVVFVPSWYKVPSRPAVGSFFEEQARVLQKRGIKVGVFYPLSLSFRSRFRHDPTEPEAPSDTCDDGIATYYHFRHKLLPRARRLNDWHLRVTAARRFCAYMKAEGRPDLVHSHAAFDGGTVARQLSRELNLPWVHTEHLSLLVREDGYNDPESRRIAASVLREPREVAVVSRSFATALENTYELPPQAIRVIPNVVSPLFEKAFEPRPLSSPFRFFTNSFLNPGKNHRLLFEAFKKLLEDIPEAELRVGGGSYSGYDKELKDCVTELGLESKVTFLGFLSRQEVQRELIRCHAFVLTSRFETFGVVLIEALAVGRPVVSTDCGGPREIIQEGDGLLVTEHQPEAFAAAMRRLVDDYGSYEPRAISERCLSRFGEQRIGDLILEMYEAALA